MSTKKFFLEDFGIKHPEIKTNKVTEAEAALLLGQKKRYLQELRRKGIGPKHYRVQGTRTRCFYLKDDLADFLASSAVLSA